MGDLRSKFMEIYSALKVELLNDPAFEFTDTSRHCVDRMVDYNVHGGKLNRGISVIDSYKLLFRGKELSDEEFFLASALGWCIEWLQAYLLVLDDIEDNSHLRHGRPCWFRLPQIGMVAVNDGIVLRNHICRILKNHFKGKPYYVDLLDLFNETRILKIILMSRTPLLIWESVIKYRMIIWILLVTQKWLVGTDIEDFKCSWLVVKALECCNDEQKKLLYANYGKADQACVTKLKQHYNALDLQAVFTQYESESHEKLIKSIEAHPSKAVQAVLKSFLAKIYKRQK
ncbi:hypothetical protein EZV62_009345 [Acer yangbiense]|uniref:Uncharacterized protein n=1 Tax=Acer yangbiense TaxID=1000413 RepID=A0A5C7IFF0_9ROSI|nr:hypothetical protein EZV62_009345 [Acer yangbiense]